MPTHFHTFIPSSCHLVGTEKEGRPRERKEEGGFSLGLVLVQFHGPRVKRGPSSPGWESRKQSSRSPSQAQGHVVLSDFLGAMSRQLEGYLSS